MKVWTCDDFTGHYPVGTAAVVVAQSEADARLLLIDACRARGLVIEDFTVKPLDSSVARAVVLCDGNY